MFFYLHCLPSLISGGSKNLKVNESSLVQCDSCEAKVSLKRLEQHRKLRCQVCDHHHPHHGRTEYCCSCIGRCKKCGPFSFFRHIQKRSRCKCGHYHALGKTCSSFADPSTSYELSFTKEQHSDSDSIVQSMVIGLTYFTD